MTDFLLWIFFIAWACQLVILLVFAFRLAFFNVEIKNYSTVNQPISVIICARNEAPNLKNNLPAILRQEYNNFEVIVVNDASEDNTTSILKELSLEYPQLRVVTISKEEKSHLGKKQALKKGVLAAAHSVVLLTDADCYPVSPNWITSMSAHFISGKSIVLGYSPALPQRGWLNKLIRFDVLYTAVQYLGLAIRGMPYMGVGRNLAYRKELALGEQINMHLDLASGDDDLFIHQVANDANTVVNIAPEARVLTLPEIKLKAYYHKKRRHFTTSSRYSAKYITILGIWNVSKLVFYITLVILLASNSGLFGILSVLVIIYLITMMIAYSKITKNLGERDLLLFVPIMDVISVFFNSFVVATTFFSNSIKWK